MHVTANDIEILSAPSILGFRPTGMEDLGKSLLASGLEKKLHSTHPVVHVPTLNSLYSAKRDNETHCLNPGALRDFSLTLSKAVSHTISKDRFPLVLGGDCSLLLGITPALKEKGTFGLIFIDAHADFYEPEKSTTGEVADMDLAIVTGRGPGILTNINNLGPYVSDENVVHIGQRDWEETKKFGSQDIRETSIKCFDFKMIRQMGEEQVIKEVLAHLNTLQVDGFWIHFDTDVLSEEVNPAVEYHLPGGLTFGEVEYIIKSLMPTGRIVGMTVTIFNPRLDPDGSISRNIVECLGAAFNNS